MSRSTAESTGVRSDCLSDEPPTHRKGVIGVEEPEGQGEILRDHPKAGGRPRFLMEKQVQAHHHEKERRQPHPSLQEKNTQRGGVEAGFAVKMEKAETTDDKKSLNAVDAELCQHRRGAASRREQLSPKRCVIDHHRQRHQSAEDVQGVDAGGRLLQFGDGDLAFSDFKNIEIAADFPG